MPQYVKFSDPKTGDTYTWPTNPAPDAVTTASQKQRQIDRTSNTAHVGLVKQQGDDGPYVMHWEPHIFSEAHEQALWTWYVLSGKRTIYLTDWNGEEYEGQIITLARQQIGAISGPGDTFERKFFAKYVFEFEVWRFISGVLAAAGVKP